MSAQNPANDYSRSLDVCDFGCDHSSLPLAASPNYDIGCCGNCRHWWAHRRLGRPVFIAIAAVPSIRLLDHRHTPQSNLTLKEISVDVLNEAPVQFGYRIAVLRNWYGGPAYRQLESERGLTDSETSVIFFLGRCDGSRAQDITNIIGRPKNSISRAVHLLIDKKLLFRVADKVDRRQKLLFLTEAGWETYHIIVPMFLARERALIETLTAPELAFLDAILAKMVDHLPKWINPY